MRLAYSFLLIVIAWPSLAHHAPALYDNDRLMSLASEVIELKYRFPHSQLRIRTIDGEEWTVSLAPPDVSERQGKKAALLAIKPGEQVTVFGWPHKVKRYEIRSHKLVFADGRVIEGAFNSLYEPSHQKRIKRMLADPAQMEKLARAGRPFSRDAGTFADWVDEMDAVSRLALDISRNDAFFIATEQGTFPGVKEHLQCLPSRHRREAVSGIDDDRMAYVRQRNEYYARYLEGQLNICD